MRLDPSKFGCDKRDAYLSHSQLAGASLFFFRTHGFYMIAEGLGMAPSGSSKMHTLRETPDKFSFSKLRIAFNNLSLTRLELLLFSNSTFFLKRKKKIYNS